MTKPLPNERLRALMLQRGVSTEELAAKCGIDMKSVERWLSQPEKPEPYLQSTLYAKVVLALLTGREANDLLDAQRSEHLRLMRELTARRRDGDIADVLICDHALFHLEADVRWLELTAARLEDLKGAIAV